MSVYDPSIFTKVKSLAEAKRVILTPERVLGTEERWQRETPHIADLIEHQVSLQKNDVVVDYGCGVGRVTKEILGRTKCNIIGVDISPNMRALAASYVNSEWFAAIDPAMMEVICPRARLVLAVWVLQHVSDLDYEIGRIRKVMDDDAVLFVVNELSLRFVPTTCGWVEDGIDVADTLDKEFKVLSSGKLDPAVVGEEQSARTYWAAYTR